MESRIAPAKHAANESLVRLAGLERPHEVFGWLKAPKGGGAPTHSGLLPAPKLNVAPRASSVLLNTSVHHRGERNARQKVICVFHATFTRHVRFRGDAPGGSRLWFASAWLAGEIPARTPLTYREAKKSKNVRDEI